MGIMKHIRDVNWTYGIGKENYMNREKKVLDKRILNIISVVAGLLLWQVITLIPDVNVILASPSETFAALLKAIERRTIFEDIASSMFRVLSGFTLGLLLAIPVGFLMGWYKTFSGLVEPWIQFFRTIPPIAMIPLVIVALGVGESAKIVVIFFASFLVIVISIYQGVRNVDVTMIKAARVLGANDRDIFLKVVVPASTPYILVGVRLGLAASLTTLIAAELTGAQIGLGEMIQSASLYFKMDVVILGIVTIGIIGFTLDKIVLLLERKLTGWQETREM